MQSQTTSQKALQQEKMSALRGKEFSELTIQTLGSMKNERDFSFLYKKTKSMG